MIIQSAIEKIRAGASLSIDEAQHAFDEIFSGEVEAALLEAFLVGLRRRGETQDELQGAVRSMRSHMKTISAPDGAMDIVGTGGDGHGTYNVSTAAAFVVAGAGVPVAKHGNRAATSRSGSSDVLAALGVNLEPKWDVLEKCLNDVGIAFLFAPRHHPAMKHVAAVRKKIGVRTIFNLLGPLTNPANVRHHLIGVFAPAWREPMAQTLASLGSERAWIVCGHSGLDEISTTGSNQLCEMKDGTVSFFDLSPEDVGISLATLQDLKGGDPIQNAEATRRLLKGEKGAYRDIVVLNAAAALVVAGKVREIEHGIMRAQDSIDSGAARAKLEQLIALTDER